MFISKNLFCRLVLGFAESSPPSKDHGRSQPCPLHTCLPQDGDETMRGWSELAPAVPDGRAEGPGELACPLAPTSPPPSGPVLTLQH